MNEFYVIQAKMWYIKHKLHIDNLVRGTAASYAPSQQKDVQDPSLWNGQHWKWFLINFE